MQLWQWRPASCSPVFTPVPSLRSSRPRPRRSNRPRNNRPHRRRLLRAAAPRGKDAAGTGSRKRRALADPAVIERGTTLYGINCRLCHGADLRGGDLGGINLLRSQLVLIRTAS